MITTIIFSFDRPMQLSLLLDSLLEFDQNKQLEVNILYAFSSSEFEKGYNVLKEKHIKYRWIEELRYKERFVIPTLPLYYHNYYWWLKFRYNRWVGSNFKTQVISLLSNSKNKFVMFLTDDSLFYSSVEINPAVLSEIALYPQRISYSLRHGTNIVGGKFEELADRIIWQLTSTHSHPEWSYPFSVDGHIYDKEIIRQSFETVIFKNPNTLESHVACYVKEHRLLNTVIANQKSCLLGFELNRVQQIVNNHNLNIDASFLNEKFLIGFRLEINFDASSIHHFRPQEYSVQIICGNNKIKLV